MKIAKLGMNHPMGPLLAKYVEAGWLGKKAGRGFYVYSPGASGAPA